MKKFFSRIKLGTWIIVLVLAVGGFFGFRYWQARKAASVVQFQTVEAQKGSLTATIGATGTVRSSSATSSSASPERTSRPTTISSRPSRSRRSATPCP